MPNCKILSQMFNNNNQSTIALLMVLLNSNHKINNSNIIFGIQITQISFLNSNHLKIVKMIIIKRFKRKRSMTINTALILLLNLTSNMEILLRKNKKKVKTNIA